MKSPWDGMKLGDMFTLQRGYDLPGRSRKPGRIPIISSAGPYDFHNVNKVKHPGVVTGRYGTIGEVFYIEEDFWPLNTTLYVSDFKKNNPLYISYLLKTVNFATHSGKSGVPGINRNDIHELPVFRPPVKEQTTIANTLSDVDALITSLEKLIAKKRAIKTAAMQQLLTGKKRLPPFDKTHTGYKQTELGEIPEDWEVVAVGKSLTIRHGKDQKQIKKEDGLYPILGTGGEIGRTNTHLYDKPSVLIGRKGTINKPIYMESPFWTVDTLFYSEVREKFCSKYIYYKFCQIDWMSYNEASGVPSLNASTVEDILQSFPVKKEQVAISSVLTDMDIEIDSLQWRLVKTQQLKQGMMQELLTGKTRLL